jgi:hypothetical protein
LIRLVVARRRAHAAGVTAQRLVHGSWLGVPTGLRDEVVLHGVESGRRPRGDAELGVDVLYVVVRSLGRDDETPGNLGHGAARGEQAQNFHLPVREPAGPGGPSRSSLARHGKNPGDGIRVQAAGLRFLL